VTIVMRVFSRKDFLQCMKYSEPDPNIFDSWCCCGDLVTPSRKVLCNFNSLCANSYWDQSLSVVHCLFVCQ